MNSKVGEKVLESAVELNCATVAVWFYHHPKDGRGEDARGRRVGTERGGKEKEREGEEEREDARRNERGDAERRRDESIVAVGSYEHTTTKSGGAEEGEEEAKEERIGRVTLFRCSRKREEEEKEEKEEENVNASSPDSSSRSRRPRGEEKISFDVCGELDAISRARCGGAFDLKFGNASRSEGGRVELAMACANNRLEVFEMTMDGDADFDDDDGGKQERLVRLKPTAQFECGFGGIGLCTSAAWSCRDRSIVATGDDGAAVVVDYERATMMASSGGRDGVEGDNSQVLFRVENAHADAIWASSFLDGSEDVFFTGGDDCKLIKHDLREMGSRSSGEFAYPSQTSQNFRFEKNPVFDAGVTTIESKGDILYVGSYDGACRAFDVRKSLKEPLWISRGNDDENEDGEEAASIWRVRLHPNFAATSKRSGKIALASMKAGCRVISSLDGSTVGTYRNGHDDDKVVYGCDWAFTNDATEEEEEEEKEGFVSCSFYDRRVHVWTL